MRPLWVSQRKCSTPHRPAGDIPFPAWRCRAIMIIARFRPPRREILNEVFAPGWQGRRIGKETYPFAQRVGWHLACRSEHGHRQSLGLGRRRRRRSRRNANDLLSSLRSSNRARAFWSLITRSVFQSGKRERHTHGLRDMHELVDVAAKGGVSLWLHGHRHGFYYLPRPSFAPFPIICGGSSTQTGLWSHCEYTVSRKSGRSPFAAFTISEKNMFEDADRFALQLMDV